MTAEALQLIVQISREPNKTRRITHVTALDGIDENTGKIRLVNLFTYDRPHDNFRVVARPPALFKGYFEKNNVQFPDWIFKNVGKEESA